MYKYIKLLDLLKKNEIVKYEMVNISRNGLRQAIYRLRESGYKIENVFNEGYILKKDETFANIKITKLKGLNK